MFCKECGLKISDSAISCPKCGCPTQKKNVNKSNKNNTTALLLCLFLGIFGAHRFYVGKTGSAIAMLILTCTMFGMCVTGIWAFIDFFVICCGNFTDKNGKTLSWS